jgi:hypothetical protein
MPSPSANSHRLTVTVPAAVYQRLLARAFNEGRSVSNLMAFLVETGLDAPTPDLSRLG